MEKEFRIAPSSSPELLSQLKRSTIRAGGLARMSLESRDGLALEHLRIEKRIYLDCLKQLTESIREKRF